MVLSSILMQWAKRAPFIAALSFNVFTANAQVDSKSGTSGPGSIVVDIDPGQTPNDPIYSPTQKDSSEFGETGDEPRPDHGHPATGGIECQQLRPAINVAYLGGNNFRLSCSSNYAKLNVIALNGATMVSADHIESQPESLDLSHLPSGIYVAYFVDPNGLVIAKTRLLVL